jgi:hypothetical protein
MPPWRRPPQDIDLPAQHEVLRLERSSRSEPPDERPPDHSAKVPHWTAASPILPPLASRTRFTTGTGMSRPHQKGFKCVSRRICFLSFG